MAQEEKRWWEVIFGAQEPEESAYLLIELGAEGLSLEEQDKVRAYFKGTDQELSSFRQEAQGLGFKLVHQGLVKEENWLQNCREIWQPVQIGQITITPVLSEQEKPSESRKEHELLILPGTGFGTGHHASTRLVLQFLQDPRFRKNSPGQALDVGTGSGVLAIACADLFHCPVTAIDNDAAAIENAAVNVKLNNKENLVTLNTGEARSLSGSYDLILANIYAELLIGLAPRFKGLLKPQGFAVLSGIVKPFAIPVRQGFEAAGFRCLEEREEAEWVGMLLGSDF